MINIDQYIHELIMLSECIILPDFGGFETTYRPAVIDKKSSMLLPPSKHIVFRENLKRDNGVLVDYIAQHENLEKEIVRKKVDDYVRQLNDKLNKEKQVHLTEIGIFKLDKNNHIIFEAFKEENLLADSFGLGEIHVDSRNAPLSAEPEYNMPLPLEQTGRKRTRLWIVAGGVLIIVLIALLIPLSRNFSGPDKQSLFSLHLLSNKSSEDQEKITFGKQVKIDSDSVDLAVEEKIDARTNKEKALLYSEDDDRKGKDYSDYSKFYLIAGSFKSFQNASKMKELLMEKGYSPEIIQTKNLYYRVVLDSCTDRDYALKELEKYRNGLSQSVWILSI